MADDAQQHPEYPTLNSEDRYVLVLALTEFAEGEEEAAADYGQQGEHAEAAAVTEQAERARRLAEAFR